MEKLVTLKQFFNGNSNPVCKYCYLLEDPKIGMLVSDKETYVGKVIGIKDIDSEYKYKKTYVVNKETATKILEELIIDATYSDYLKEYEKLRDRGGYYDPNFGWCSVDELDIDEEQWFPSEKEINQYVEKVMKELI